MPPPPEPTDADREYAREQAEAWCEEYTTDMGGGFAPNEHWVNGVASRILAGILRERGNLSEDHDMANGCLNMIHDILSSLGCSHGKDQHHTTPAMMYPEWLVCVVNHHVATACEWAAQEAIRVLGGEQNEWAKAVAAAIRRGPQ